MRQWKALLLQRKISKKNREAVKDLFTFDNMDELLKKWCEAQPPAMFYRLVDPGTFDVYDCQDGKVKSYNQKCYELWKRDTPCVNCASRRAILTGQQVVKLEYLQDQVFLVRAAAFEIEGKTLSLELADDVSKSFLVKFPMLEDNSDIGTLILAFNDLAIRDAFTGLYNKNHIADELMSAINEYKRDGKPFAAALIDLDGFKAINDTMGHVFGDEVLLSISEYIKTLMKCHDVSGSRYGGDEFFLLFKNTDEAKARELCLRLQESLAAHDFKEAERRIPITFSWGVGEYREGESPSAFLDRLDRRMYQMKQERR